MKIKSIAIVTGISLLGALLFELCSFPVPWMLGPLFTVMISQFFIKTPLNWPLQFRNIGLIIIGISIGQTFQLTIFKGMGWLILLIFILNCSLVVGTLFIAWGIKKWGNVSLKTALLSTVPGGIGQMIILAEEEKDTDLAVVTYFHVVRVISIVLLIPFLLSNHTVQQISGKEFSFNTLMLIILLISVAFVIALFGKKIKIPVPYFLTPMLLIILLTSFSIQTEPIPEYILHMAQLMMGAYIGTLLKPHMMKLGKKVLLLGIGSALLLLVITFVQGLFLTWMLDYSIPTSFLSTAAGGLDQMSLIATAIGADVSIVTVFQIFRLLFVFLIVLPLIKMACSYIDQKDANQIG